MHTSLQVLTLVTCAFVLRTTSVGSAQDNGVIVSPTGTAVAFYQSEEGGPERDENRRLKFGRIEINTRNNAPWHAPNLDHIAVVRLENQTEHQILAPFNTTLGWVRFSPNGSYLSYVVIRDTGVEQWIFDLVSGIPRPLTSASLNATWGEPCQWLADSTGVLCTFVRSGRGSPPEGNVPLFEYYLTSQLATVQLETGRRRDVGSPAILTSASTTEDGQSIIVVRLTETFSPRAPVSHVVQSIETWDREGRVLHQVTKQEP
jgi:Tol biopolymer transport system component